MLRCPSTIPRPIRELALCAVLAVFAVGIWYVRVVLQPVIIGLVLAYIAHPGVRFLHRRLRMPRRLAVLLILGAGVAVAAAAGRSVIPLVLEQGSAFFRVAPAYAVDFVRSLSSRWDIEKELLPDVFAVDPEIVLDAIREVGNAASSLLLNVLFAPFFFFQFAWHLPCMYRRLRRAVPRSARRKTYRILTRVDAATGNFLRGRVLTSMGMGMVLAAGWYVAGVPYWMFLGIVTGLLGIAPYLSNIGWLAAVALTCLDAQSCSWLDIVNPTVVFAAANVVEEFILTPWIQSKAVSVSPAGVVLAVIAGGAAAGIFGVLVAIPVLGAAKIVLQETVPVFSEKSEKRR